MQHLGEASNIKKKILFRERRFVKQNWTEKKTTENEKEKKMSTAVSGTNTGASVVCGVMSVIMFAGGAIGYFKKGSKASLISGAVCGGAYAVLALNWQPLAAKVLAAAMFVAMGFRAASAEFARVPTLVALLNLLALLAFFFLTA